MGGQFKVSRQPNEKLTFDIFTRIKRGDDLVQIGTVEAESPKLAKVYAVFIYDEEDWTEMCVVERGQLHWAKKTEGLFAKKGA
ncbi:hypothetical protein H9631_12310 [Bacillus sp. Sa1BUA2]|uniref:Uncharacterized protein n=1 Tax=Bacillus norwichensis TaxID=2762217 RepID=A0ABR8VMP1_9BACI|nr:hypothetical protein [Bacillus norwichensis]MBD8005861.1 hypothetical protein [Bacillus norwichensis]